MFKNIKNLLNNILEDYKSDKYYRGLAQDLISKIQLGLTDNSLRVTPSSLSVTGGDTRFSLKGIAIDLEDIDSNFNVNLKVIYPDDRIKLGFKGRYLESTEIFGDTSKAIIVVMPEPIDPDLLIKNEYGSTTVDVDKVKEEFNSELFKPWSDISSTLVHELTHFLDSLRYKGDNVVGNYINRNSKDGKLEPEDYFNSPHEYNAFFQGEVDRFETKLNSIGYLRREFKKFKTPKEMLNFLLSNNGIFEFNSRFLEFLNSKYSRKFKKRLVGYLINKQKEIIAKDDEIRLKNQALYGDDK